MSAGPGFGIEVRGLGELSHMLSALPANLVKARKQAARKGATQVSKFWKIRLGGPRSARRLGVRSGNLRASILIGQLRGDASIAVGTSLPYAAPWELGFRGDVRVPSHTRAGRDGSVQSVREHTRRVRMPAKPHRAPAMRDAAPIVHLIYDGKVGEAIELSRRMSKHIKSGLKAEARRAA